MTKSVLAHLVGRAVRDGALALDDAVTDHVPELARHRATTAPPSLDLLTMTTGVDWVEDHRDPDSLASRLLGCFADRVGDSRALLARGRPGVPPGTRFAYCTADSQVLDWVRERATGRSVRRRRRAAVGGARLHPRRRRRRRRRRASRWPAAASPRRARDWARVAARSPWTAAADAASGCSTATGSRRPPGRRTRSCAVGRLPSSITTHAGFGYHWWPMDDAGHRVTADGSRGQFAYADRRTGAVVVKTSQWPYDDFLVDRQARDLSYLGLHALAGRSRHPSPRRRSTRP